MHTQTPKLRFPKFSDKWEVKKLGEIIKSIDSGWSPQCEDYPASSNEWGVLKTTSVAWEGFDESENKKLPDLLEPKKNIEVQTNDILITRAGPTNRVGVTVHVNIVRPKLLLSDKIIRIRTIKEYSSKFVAISLSNIEAQKQIVSKSSGLATSQTNISQDILLNVLLKCASLPEQTKIANFLTAIDEKIQALKQKKTLLEQYKKGIMQQIFSQQLRLKNDDGSDFDDWEEKSLGEVYSFKSTNSFSRENLNYESGSVRNIHYGDIHTKFKTQFSLNKELVPFVNEDINLSKIPEANYCKEGDLIIADASEDYADIGKSIEIINLDNEKVLAGLHTFLVRPDLSKISIGFGGHLMKAYYVRLQIMTIAQGTKVLSISTGRLSTVEINLPSLPEQQKIANFLTAIDEKIEKVSQQIKATETYKKGLLQQMFV